MGVVPLILSGARRSVVFEAARFSLNGGAILFKNCDRTQFKTDSKDSNISYDLRIGEVYRDHRNPESETLGENGFIKLRPGNAVIIQTEEWVEFPKSLFGQILPRVTLLQKGIANTPSKIDPGYKGYLLITTFNHGKRVVKLKRKECFCSLHVLSVDDGVRPYDKPGKYLVGKPVRRTIQSLKDYYTQNIPQISFLTLIFTIVLVIIGVITLLKGGSFIQGWENAAPLSAPGKH